MNRTAAIGAIVIVEPWAHRPNGHFPNRFAELADAFTELGLPVAVLTSDGWHAQSMRQTDWAVHSYSNRARKVIARAERISLRWQRRRPRVKALARLVACVTGIHQARHVARIIERTNPNTIAGIVTLDYQCSPLLLDLFSGSRPWIQHIFAEGPPFASLRPLAVAVAQLRRLRGRSRSRVAMALSTEGWIGPMRSAAPNPHPVLLRLAGTRPVPGEGDNPRVRLALRGDLPVALHFGSTSVDRRPVTVAKAFAGRNDWQLLLVGEMAEVLADPDLEGTAWAVPPVALGGIVSDEIRSLVFSAADLVILSFRPGFDRNSGTLMDAISFGKPVVVSGPSYPADLVSELGIGSVYASEDPYELGKALDALTLTTTSGALADARQRFSNSAIARAHFELLVDLANDNEDAAGQWLTIVRP